MEKRFFVWVGNVLKVLVYVQKDKRWGGSDCFVRIEDPKARA